MKIPVIVQPDQIRIRPTPWVRCLIECDTKSLGRNRSASLDIDSWRPSLIPRL